MEFNKDIKIKRFFLLRYTTSLARTSMDFNNAIMIRRHFRAGAISLSRETFLFVRIPNALVLRILYRSLFLALFLSALPFLRTVLKGFSSAYHSNNSKSLDVALMNSIFYDFVDQGLLRENDKVLVVNSPVPNVFGDKIDVVVNSDFERKGLFNDESYDFVFTSGSIDAEFIDRVLKIDGVVALPLGAKPLNSAFKEQTNYRVVFLKRNGVVIVGLKKIGPAIQLFADSDSCRRRKLLETKAEAKTMALKGLEDVFLEPPRKALVKSKTYLNNIKYLPDLLGDSLEGYNKRVFISVGLPEENKGVMQWFQKDYPKKNTQFETHSLAVGPEDYSIVSDWLSKNVKEEEYVVMKAEAEVVEDMMKKRTIGLVDELFFECNNEWWHTGKRKKNERAYWECLALYGRIRDEGVAVHQWWG